MRKSDETNLVLVAIADHAAPVWGLAICRSTELKPGTVYPILKRLEQRRWITAEWEAEPTGHKGPRRRLYSLTDQGRSALAEISAQQAGSGKLHSFRRNLGRA
jgi:PadR family transcriptional regulator, regulatory protein PadR